MAHDVFISHLSKDKKIADALCNKLEGSGIGCWMVPRDIPPGAGWAEAIIEAINKARLMILVFSSNANSSPQIEREVERAANKGVMIVPFRIEDVQPSGSFEFYLSTSHWLDALMPPVEQHLQHLVERVKLSLLNLPKKAMSDDEEIVREKEEARRSEVEDVRRREEELERKRHEAEAKRKQQEAEAEAARKAKEISTRMPHDVFISYSSKDRLVADAMCHKLESNGIRCWIAPRNILAGMDWGGAIMDAIKKCQLMVLVLSSNANASRVVRREVERAASKGVLVVPFRIEDVQPDGSLELYLSTSHWLDALTPPVEQHLQRLVEDVKELMPMLPTRVVNDVEGMTQASVEEKIEAELRAIRAREREVEIAGHIREEAARRREEERAQERQEAEKLKRSSEVAAVVEAEKRAAEIERRIADGTVPANMTNRIGMEFVWIPPGSFMMGSEYWGSTEKPAHQVRIRAGFYMGKYEVNQAQWQMVMGNNPSNFKGDNLPVERVSWDDAQEFIRKLNAMTDGFLYRLPSEAEWEYACRAGTTEEYAGDLDSIAWYARNSREQTHPVGQKHPNAFGLYDMHGNVGEWCQDYLHDNYQGAPHDGSAWLDGADADVRVLRGGSWINIAFDLRSAKRSGTSPEYRGLLIGLRLVAEALPQPTKAGHQTLPAPPLRETPTPAAADFPRTFKNQVGIEFVFVPPGDFMMGSESGEADEKPVHHVTIRRGFYLGKYAVTQSQWQQVMGVNPSYFKGDNLPVEQVTWNHAQEFIEKLNAMTGDFVYRLPSEAEWEYACRAGTTGDYAGDLDSMAWYGNNSGREYLDAEIWRKDGYGTRIIDNGGQSHPVGQKQPNAFGLYDMHGNVWERCQDNYHNDYVGAPTDGSAWLGGSSDRVSPGSFPGHHHPIRKSNERVSRGGSWFQPPGDLRSANRSRILADISGNDGGLRLVAEALPQPTKAGHQTVPAPPVRETPTPAADDFPRTFKNQVGIEFVFVPPGDFMMGSERSYGAQPVHRVTIREGFYTGKYQVTQAQWLHVMDNNPAHLRGDNLPVESVSWNDAQEFIQQLNAMNDGFIYRLPSEAEWEYACRAGTTGDYAGDFDSMAWYGNNSQDQTHPVGQKFPNAFGLYDMHGNVSEWCEDYYHENYSGAPSDGSPRWSGAVSSQRVMRGGSFVNACEACRSACRAGRSPDSHNSSFGFRIVASAVS